MTEPRRSSRLTKRLRDPDLRYRAIDALGDLGPAATPASPAPARLLEEGILREEAMQALGEIGPGAECAAPLLRTQQSD